MNYLFSILSILMISITYAQEFTTTTLNNVVYSMDYPGAKQKVTQFIQKNNIAISYQDENKQSLSLHFNLPENLYSKYDSLIESCGYSTTKKFNTINNTIRVSELKIDIAHLQAKQKEYSVLLAKIEEKNEEKTENYLNFWREKQNLEDQIHQKERELLNFSTSKNQYAVELFLSEELTTTDNARVKFVNMPGGEFSFLNIDSPTKGISASNYQGYFLKYLFTQGKSYITLGVYKANTFPAADSLMFSELFAYSFGQDFYSRHLGRGSRKFLNLYSGYSIGGMVATGRTSKEDIFYIAPSIGLEIYKNKYLLIDSKVNYFIPFMYNKEMRGLSANISLSVVF